MLHSPYPCLRFSGKRPNPGLASVWRTDSMASRHSGTSRENSNVFNRITGELLDREKEASFLDDAWPRQRLQLLIVVGICCTGVALVMIANLGDGKMAPILSSLLALRVFQLGVMLWSWAMCLYRQRPKTVSVAIGLAELVTVFAEGANFAIAFELSDHGGRPGMPFIVMLLFVFYTLIPIRFIYSIAVGTIAGIGNCLLLAHFFDLGFDEVSYIAAMFIFVNLLGIGYGSYINRLQRQDFLRRKELERQISQRELAEQDALVLKEVAERASAEKSRFIAIAGHDLRQPIHALGLWVDNLEERLAVGDINESRTLVDRVTTAKDSLTDLLDRLLHVAHLEAGVTDVDIEPIALKPLVSELTERHANSAAKRRIRLSHRSCKLIVESDPLLLQRILDNFTDNAIKYADAGGQVLIGTRRRGEYAVIQVWNTGAGIPADELERVFDEFHQIEQPGGRRVRGIGLGLAIVRRLADLLGHRIDVISEPGRLTCFSITVPLSMAAAVAAIRPRVDGHHGRPQKVLVADDDIEILDAMSQLLQRWGHQVERCRNEEEVWAAVDRMHPELIITDLQLGENANGIDVIKAVIENTHLACPVILMTGDTTTEGLQKASQSGFVVLEKPVQPARLRVAMTRLVREGLVA